MHKVLVFAPVAVLVPSLCLRRIAIAAARSAKSTLFIRSQTITSPRWGVIAIPTAIGLLASYVPADRSSRLDPPTALSR